MTPLTPEIERLIIAAIRKGTAPGIAAATAGGGGQDFKRWMRSEPPFRQKVRQAWAQARAEAEWEVRKKDVKFWLRYGPGKPMPRRRAGKEDEAMMQLVSVLFTALTPFPDARQAAADAIERASSHFLASWERQ
ncbi:MAG: hypothetical protein K2R98_02390 [Gemmataceae bacterium]|nr:hypothetical protein [Gemmataceae bacterium]